MNKKKIIWLSIAVILLIAAIFDAIRYLKPGAENKQKVQQERTFPITSAKEMILAYNAYGGIYPGIVDIIHKEFFPKSYPCNLCYLTFGTFSMKEEWKEFIDSLPYKKVEIHKDQFKKTYQPEDLPLPVILISDGNSTDLLVSAAEINKCKTLQQLKDLVLTKLKN
jgi:hypothetical protein